MSSPVMPRVGDGATLAYPSDRYPYRVTHVSANGAVIEIEALDTSGFVMNSNLTIDGIIPPDEFERRATGRKMRAHRRADGHYSVTGTPVVIGRAVFHQNWAD